MEKLTVDKLTKIIFGLYHFFVPMMYYIILPGFMTYKGDEITPEKNSILATIFVLVVLFAIYIVFNKLSDYKKFIQIDDNYISVCEEGSLMVKKFQQIDIKKIEQINKFKVGKALSVKTCDGKNVDLINISPSLWAVFPTFPIVSKPFTKKAQLIHNKFEYELNALADIPTENKKAPSYDLRFIQFKEFIANFFSWVFLLFIILPFGLFGFLFGITTIFAVFYPGSFF